MGVNLFQYKTSALIPQPSLTLNLEPFNQKMPSSENCQLSTVNGVCLFLMWLTVFWNR